MDKVYEAALNRLTEIEAEARNLREFIELFRATRRLLGLDERPSAGTGLEPSTDTVVDKSPVDGPGIEPTPAPRPPVRTRIRTNPAPSIVTKAAVEILREAGQPLTRRQIHERLTRRGIVVEGADRVKTLGTMLWRAGAFDQIEGYGYWIKGETPPDGVWNKPVAEFTQSDMDILLDHNTFRTPA